MVETIQDGTRDGVSFAANMPVPETIRAWVPGDPEEATLVVTAGTSMYRLTELGGLVAGEVSS